MLDYNEVRPGTSTSMWHGRHSSCNCHVSQSAEAPRVATHILALRVTICSSKFSWRKDKRRKPTRGRETIHDDLHFLSTNIEFVSSCQFSVSLDSRVLLYWRYGIGYPHPLLVDTPIYQRSNPNPVLLKIAIVRRYKISKLLIIPHWLLALVYPLVN
jgi:hypothetical protein